MRHNLMLLALLLAACSATQKTSTQTAIDLDEAARDEEPIYDLDEPIAIERSRTGSIDRGKLDAILELGPGQFLRKVEVDVVLDGGKFNGWRIVRYDHPWVDLRPGDVVHSVNGSPLKTPTDLNELWADLATAGEIVVQVARGEEDFELRFDVQGQPVATQP